MKREDEDVLDKKGRQPKAFHPPEKSSLAFALGGLAGNNAFGAGFLQTAFENNLVPSMITATSGQVFWVYRYLQNLVLKSTAQPFRSLEDQLADDLADLTPPGLVAGELRKVLPEKAMGILANQVRVFAEVWKGVPLVRDFAWWWLSWAGKPGRYATASHHLPLDCTANALAAARSVFQNIENREAGRISIIEFLSSIWPDRGIESAFPDNLFKDMAEMFNSIGKDESGIGVVFNAYDPVEGIEYIHLNKRARQLLGRRYGEESSHRQRTRYLPINANAVRSALWLYAYGFHEGNSTLDGAYFRDVILSEACGKDITKICAVRPLPYRWIGNLPRNYIGGKDLETEVSFNGAYAGERDKIMLINKIVDGRNAAIECVEGLAKEKSFPASASIKECFKELNGYKKIDLIEIEPNEQRGYFDYVFEDEKLFKHGMDQSVKRLAAHQLIPG